MIFRARSSKAKCIPWTRHVGVDGRLAVYLPVIDHDFDSDLFADFLLIALDNVRAVGGGKRGAGGINGYFALITMTFNRAV